MRIASRIDQPLLAVSPDLLLCAARMRSRFAQRLVLAALAVGLLSCGSYSRTGALEPPSGAPQWEAKYASAFNDDYTREPINLSGRAPNDVLDQRLFAERLGHAHIVARVTVEQVWGRGRYEGRKDQFLDVVIEEVLMGELPKRTKDEQLLRISGQDPLPGSLQGQSMVLFVRWAPKSVPAYHHHLMPADQEIVAYIEAMVQHARNEGVLDSRGRGKRKRGQEPVDADDDLL
jgi:hypothetical protein